MIRSKSNSLPNIVLLLLCSLTLVACAPKKLRADKCAIPSVLGIDKPWDPGGVSGDERNRVIGIVESHLMHTAGFVPSLPYRIDWAPQDTTYVVKVRLGSTRTPSAIVLHVFQDGGLGPWQASDLE